MERSDSIQTNIQWRRLGGIVAVQGSVTLAWVIYSLYLPDLLVRLGFAKELAGTLLIIEHAIEVVVEPTFGYLTDRAAFGKGTRFPWIAIGIALASAFFIALPIVALFVPAGSIWRWSFPAIAVLWASAMAMFRSPVVALLGKTTSQPNFPLAASCIVLIQQLIKAFRFAAYSLILSFGPFVTFAIGSFVFLGAGTVLRRVMPASSPPLPSENGSPISRRTLLIIAATGLGMGWSLRFLLASLGQVFAAQLGSDRVTLGMLGFNLLLAIFALPAGKLASRVGNARSMVVAAIATAILLAIIASTSVTVIVAIAIIILGFSFATVLDSMIPFVLGLVPSTRAGLGVGTFFGAFGGSISIAGLAFSGITELSLQAFLGIVCLVVVSLLVVMGRKFKRDRDCQS